MSYINIPRIVEGSYPNIYILDDFGGRGDRAISVSLNIDANSHGDKTIKTIESIAAGLSARNVFKTHILRPISIIPTPPSNVFPKYDFNYPYKNILDALFSLLLLNSLRVGDILIANVETENGENNSIVADYICKEMLKKIAKLGVVVIIPAGNKPLPINDNDMDEIGDIIVVGSFYELTQITKYATKNRYNSKLTCFAKDYVQIGDVEFTDTSASTAQITGFVLLMQKYSKSKGRFLKPREVKLILSTIGNKIDINISSTTLHNCNVPTWEAVCVEINRIILRR